MKISIKILNYNSKEYWKSISLRNKMLRKPLNLKFSEEELKKEHNQIHIASYHNNHIIGVLILVPTSNTEIKMRQVCIDTIYQNKGIGKSLVLFAEEWSLENNFSSIHCHARNTALNFYFKLDYQIKGNKFEEIGITHYKLTKKLK